MYCFKNYVLLLNSSEMSLNIGKWSSSWKWIQIFKNLISLGNYFFFFSHWQQRLSCFPWIDGLISFIFRRMSVQQPSVSYCCLSFSCFLMQKIILCEVKVASSACNSNNCISTLFWGNCLTSECGQMFYAYSHIQP